MLRHAEGGWSVGARWRALNGHAHGLLEELGDDGRADPDLRQHRQAVGVHEQQAAQEREQEVEERVDVRMLPLRLLRGTRVALWAEEDTKRGEASVCPLPLFASRPRNSMVSAARGGNRVTACVRYMR